MLLVAKIDRLSRDVSKGALVQQLIEEEGAQVLSCDGIGNEHTPEAKLMRTMLLGFAAYERQVISFRTAVALEAKRSRGLRHNCRAPYGYQWTDDGRIEDHPTEKAAVRRICFLRSEGMTLDQVTDIMNKSRHKARGACWHRNTVYRIDCRATTS